MRSSDLSSEQREGPPAAVFARSDLSELANEFVSGAVECLGLIWEPEDVTAEADKLVDRAFGWKHEWEDRENADA